MSLLTIIYWVLLVLAVISAFAPIEGPFWPRASTVVMLVLFIIIGIKLLKPTL